MNTLSQPDQELEQRLSFRLLDVLIRAGLILAMAMLCYQVFSPFLTLMVWCSLLSSEATASANTPTSFNFEHPNVLGPSPTTFLF
jgi:hypothetical protein